MQEVRNSDGRLVCRISDEGAVEIKVKDCITRIIRNQDGTVKIIHIPKKAAC